MLVHLRRKAVLPDWLTEAGFTRWYDFLEQSEIPPVLKPGLPGHPSCKRVPTGHADLAQDRPDPADTPLGLVPFPHGDWRMDIASEWSEQASRSR